MAFLPRAALQKKKLMITYTSYVEFLPEWMLIEFPVFLLLRQPLTEKSDYSRHPLVFAFQNTQ